jgi:hypothetical protein
MARWRQDWAKVPPRLARFRARDWGDGVAAVREWKQACLAWLAENPERRLPVGDGSPLAVIREAARLILEA